MSKDRKPREPMWNDETVGTYRLEATKAAKELGYDDQCLEEIKHAETMDAISNAVARGRHRLVKEEELLASCRRNGGVEKGNDDMNTEKTFVPAGFGIDTGYIDRCYDLCVSEDKEQQQLDILQEACTKLIRAVDEIKRMQCLARENSDFISSKDVVDQWYEARSNLAKEMAHVAISLAMVSRTMGVCRNEIDAASQHKDDKLPKD